MIRCPVCGSTEIYRLAGGVMGELYRCKHCGYVGALVIEEDEKPEEKAKKADEKP
jgi:transposase-like protein